MSRSYGAGAEDTELLPVDDVEARAEEDLEIPVQDGVEMEPFNLAQVYKVLI
jgi:hypothetical protein